MQIRTKTWRRRKNSDGERRNRDTEPYRGIEKTSGRRRQKIGQREKDQKRELD